MYEIWEACYQETQKSTLYGHKQVLFGPANKWWQSFVNFQRNIQVEVVGQHFLGKFLWEIYEIVRNTFIKKTHRQRFLQLVVTEKRFEQNIFLKRIPFNKFFSYAIFLTLDFSIKIIQYLIFSLCQYSYFLCGQSAPTHWRTISANWYWTQTIPTTLFFKRSEHIKIFDDKWSKWQPKARIQISWILLGIFRPLEIRNFYIILTFFIVISGCTTRHYTDREQFTYASIINWNDLYFTRI